jgi:predicted TIM-barrel fold metal-dependent hydrolase
MDAFLARNPQHHVLFSGIYKGEIDKLAPKHKNFSAEIAFCEITNVLELMLRTFPARRLMLGTCTPLLSTRGNVDKLRCAHIPAGAKALIGADNARRFFKL